MIGIFTLCHMYEKSLLEDTIAYLEPMGLDCFHICKDRRNQGFTVSWHAVHSIDRLQWCHNEHDGVSNCWRPNFLLNRLFRGRTKKTSKLCITGLCEGNSPVNSSHKGPVMRKMFSFDDVIIMKSLLRLVSKICQSSYVVRKILSM